MTCELPPLSDVAFCLAAVRLTGSVQCTLSVVRDYAGRFVLVPPQIETYCKEAFVGPLNPKP